MKQSFNPILPNYEYVPDAEPRVFDGRVYLYGSHDKFNGKSFCLNDYISYSSSIDDLKEWRYEGVIYKRIQDPNHGVGILNRMAAPDVIKGKDGKYYLYYFIGLHSRISVAFCDKPAGNYEYLGIVKYKDSIRLGKKGEPLQFDPAIFIDDDGEIYLYTGFGPKFIPLNQYGPTKFGAMVMKLEDDMLTIKEDIKYIVPSMHNAKGTDFEAHPFFEASSMRKINSKYYFIYSSYAGHELCYAVSDYPDRDFKFGGVLVSNGDIGLSDYPVMNTGNNHGSILQLGEKFYVTYHRHTNRHPFSRQTCVEPLLYDGLHFKQSEITSMGFNGKPLSNQGHYDAGICCHLTSKKEVYFSDNLIKKRKDHRPYLTQYGKDRESNPNQYIKNICDGTTIGYKYFEPGSTELILNLKGHATGQLIVSKDSAGVDIIGEKNIKIDKTNQTCNIKLEKTNDVHALYITFNGRGRFNLHTFELHH